jgi:serine/threonine protein kinase
MSATTRNACPRCLKGIEPGTKFCSSCGLDISGVWGMDAALGGTVAVEVDSNVDTLGHLLGEATLGEYDIYGELGRGGMAAVYLGLDLALNRKVAIKTMLPELVAKPGMVERFKREAQTAAGLSHPHIIQIFTVKESRQLVYFVMKFIEGRSLESVINDKGQVPLEMAQVLLNQVGSALAYAHRKQIIHRDVKPANIMIDEDGWAIVTDFGIAKVQQAQNLTATGTAIGTPHYMSPEQFHNKAITGASDQYALGIVAYEMLTGKKPYDGATYAEIITQHLFEPIPDLRELRQDIPENIVDVVNRMMAKEPADRFPDLDAAVHALGAPTTKKEGDLVRTAMISLAKSGPQKKLRMSVPISPVPLTKKRPAPAATVMERPVASNRRGMLIALSVVGIAVLGGGGYIAMRPSAADTSVAAANVSQQAQAPTATPPQAAVPAVDSSRIAASAVDQAAREDSLRRARLREEGARRADSIRIARAAERAAVSRLGQKTGERAAAPSRATGAATQGLATLRMILSPPAEVFIDGRSEGQQSRYATELIPGTHRLRIVREGFAPKDTTVNLSASQVSTIRISLTPTP